MVSYIHVRRARALFRQSYCAIGTQLGTATVWLIVHPPTCAEECGGSWSRRGYTARWCYFGDETHWWLTANTNGWLGIGFSRNRRMVSSYSYCVTCAATCIWLHTYTMSHMLLTHMQCVNNIGIATTLLHILCAHKFNYPWCIPTASERCDYGWNR